MSLNQQHDFKQIMIRNGIRAARLALPPHDQDRGEHNCLDLAERWLNDPGQSLMTQCMIATASYRSVLPHDLNGYIHYQEIHPAVYVAEAVSYEELTEVAETIGTAIQVQGIYRYDQDDYSSPYSVSWWQMEVAWAILHDDPIPPLELTP
jgi:hypothetical protein